MYNQYRVNNGGYHNGGYHNGYTSNHNQEPHEQFVPTNEVHRGAVHWVDLNNIEVKYAQKGLRPCIVVSSERQCTSSPVIHIVPLTSSLKRTSSVTHVVLRIRGLNKMSLALCEQLTVVDRDNIQTYISDLDAVDMLQIEEAIRYAIGFK